jgi:hypothetical protein
VIGASDKHIRPAPDGKGAPDIEKEEQGNQHQDVEQLISPGTGVKRPIRIVFGFADTRTNQPHIVDEKQPNNSRVSRAQLKPRQRAIEPAEKNRLAKCASDVKKVVSKLEWPFDQSKRVNDLPRPKDKDHAQTGGNIKKTLPVPHRHRRAGIIR